MRCIADLSDPLPAPLLSELLLERDPRHDDEGVPAAAHAHPHGVHHTGREGGLAQQQSVPVTVQARHLKRQSRFNFLVLITCNGEA